MRLVIMFIGDFFLKMIVLISWHSSQACAWHVLESYTTRCSMKEWVFGTWSPLKIPLSASLLLSNLNFLNKLLVSARWFVKRVTQYSHLPWKSKSSHSQIPSPTSFMSTTLSYRIFSSLIVAFDRSHHVSFCSNLSPLARLIQTTRVVTR